MILMAFSVKGHIEHELISWKITSIVFFSSCSVVMPIMILLTICANKKKKPTSVIPKGPMYHDDDVNDVEEIEMQEIASENEILHQEQSTSGNDEVNPVPNVIHVKPIVHNNTECHI